MIGHYTPDELRAGLLARYLIPCVPCQGKGWVNASPNELPELRMKAYKYGRRVLTEGGWAITTCTLCKGTGITRPPPGVPEE